MNDTFFCTSCGTKVENSAFCTQCGTAQAAAPAGAPVYDQTVISPANQTPSANNKPALISLILGLVCIVAWLIPILGVVLSTTAIGLATKGLKSEKKGMAIAGMILGILFLAASIINWIAGAAQIIGGL